MMKNSGWLILIGWFIFGFQGLVSAQDSSRAVGTLSGGGDGAVINKRALIIGISDYHSPNLALRYADDDAELFSDYLKNVEQIPEDNMQKLLNGEATANKIYMQLRSLVETTQEGDLTYIYFAGHGDVVTRFIEDEGYFLAADANDQREYNGTGGIVAFAHLNEAVNAIIQKKGKVVLILDACRAGYVVNEDGANKTLASLNSSFQNTTKFLSSQANQLSYESEEIGHGYFTYYLTLGMMGAADISAADNELQYVELAQFLNKNVKNETGGKQSPVVQDKDLFRPYRAISTEEKELALSALQQSGGIKDMLAARSVDIIEGDSSQTDDPLVKKFNRAIGNLNMAGNDSSAYAIYTKLAGRDDYPAPLKDQMRQSLINTLSTFSQLILNSYIGGEDPLPLGSEFDKAAEYLALSLGIMDEDAYNYKQLQTSELFLKGYSIIRKKDYSNYDEAKKYLQEALEKEPRAAYVHNALGILYNHEGDYARALTSYTKAAELIPTWAFPVGNTGTNFLDQNNYARAEQYFRESIVLDPDLGTPYNNIGVVFEQLGRYNEAEYYYKASLERDSTGPVATKNIGNLYEKRGNLKAAEAWYRKALEKDSSYVYSYYSLAEFLYENDIDANYAERLLKKAIKLQPFFAQGYAELADFYRRESSNPADMDAADSLYAYSVALDPFYVWGYAGRGWLHHKQGDKKQAMLLFKKAIEVNPGKPDAYYYLGNYYKDGLDRNTAAINEYKKAIAIDSMYLSAYEKLVDIYSGQQQYDDAIDISKIIIELNPDAPDVWNMLGNLHFQTSNYYDEAISAYETAIRLDSTYAKGHVNLAYSYLNNGKYAKAEEHFRKANAYNPYKNKLQTYADYLLALGGRAYRNGNVNKTEHLYTTAYNLDASYTKTLFELSELKYLQGDIRQALTYTKQLSGKQLSRSEEIKFLILSIKIGIDSNDTVKTKQLFDRLNTINPRSDYLLNLLVHNRINEQAAQKAALQKVNRAQLSDAYLKRNYSENSIKLIHQLTEEDNDD